VRVWALGLTIAAYTLVTGWAAGETALSPRRTFTSLRRKRAGAEARYIARTRHRSIDGWKTETIAFEAVRRARDFVQVLSATAGKRPRRSSYFKRFDGYRYEPIDDGR
jgi:hypothetical protein